MKINIICIKKLGFLFDKIYVVSYKFSHDEEIPSSTYGRSISEPKIFSVVTIWGNSLKFNVNRIISLFNCLTFHGIIFEKLIMFKVSRHYIFSCWQQGGEIGMEKKWECHCLTLEQVHLLNVISDFGNFISLVLFLLLAFHAQRGWAHCWRAWCELARRGQGWRGRAQRGQWACMAWACGAWAMVMHGWACTRWGYTASAWAAFISLCFVTLCLFEEFSKLFMVMEKWINNLLKTVNGSTLLTSE
jgi:hypothetical protein